jgi:hypothetical protein
MKNCLECSREFESGKHHHKYCSQACRKLKRLSPERLARCVQCAEGFKTRGHRRIYCSKQCRRKAHAAMIKDRRICIRLGCDAATDSSCYCVFHGRCIQMASGANEYYAPLGWPRLRGADVEELWHEHVSKHGNKCPGCGVEMGWQINSEQSSLTLQHWHDETLGFLCYLCNRIEGTWKDTTSTVKQRLKRLRAEVDRKL